MAEEHAQPGVTVHEPFSGRLELDDEILSSQSAYDKELQQYTQSLHPQVTEYRFKHGRRYHALDTQAGYPFPNDEKENDRLDFQHKVYELALSGKLHFAPLHDPRRILDLGTGTGIWAIDMADHFPDAQVIGNDISPIQPRWVPPNVFFEVDNIEKEWVFHDPFDFIHARSLSSSICDWPMLLRRTFANLKPGGWAEFLDWDLVWHSPDASIAPDSPIWTGCELFRQAVRNDGLEPSPGPQIERWMREAGFKDLRVIRMPIPVGTWAADQRLKEVGAFNFWNLYEHFEGFITYTFTTQLGWSKDECDAMSALCRKQLSDPKMHIFQFLYITYGRKPELPEDAPAIAPAL